MPFCLAAHATPFATMFFHLKTIPDSIKNYAPVVEFSAVCLVLVLPPLLHNTPITIPEKPPMLSAAVMFFFRVFAAAAYEEALYRAYLPDRLIMLLERYPLPASKNILCAELFAVFCFAFAHRYLGAGSVLFAAAAGVFFRFLYRVIRHRYAVLTAYCAVWLLHACWNSAVFYYLWTWS